MVAVFALQRFVKAEMVVGVLEAVKKRVVKVKVAVLVLKQAGKVEAAVGKLDEAEKEVDVMKAWVAGDTQGGE